MTERNKPSPASAHLRQIDDVFRNSGLSRSKHKKSRPHESHTASGHASPESGGPAAAHTVCKAGAVAVLQVPGWKKYPWLLHGFSTRAGGVSNVYRPGAKHGDLNLGLTAADSPENVRRNRELFLNALVANAPVANVLVARNRGGQTSFRLLRQIHSGLVHHVTLKDSLSARIDAQGKPLLRGDGMIATEPAVVLGIQTADCIPVLVADVRQRIVAAFHAGWRGTLARIVERGVGRMRAEFGSHPGDLTAAIGPGIGRCCYSIGEEVRAEFRSQFQYADDLFHEVFDLDPVREKYPMLFLTARAPGHSDLGPSLHLDLAEANRRQLLDSGLRAEAIHVLGLCTSCDTTRFFSHRAERGHTGRMLNAIGVAEEDYARS